jgi:hypothetical protein
MIPEDALHTYVSRGVVWRGAERGWFFTSRTGPGWWQSQRQRWGQVVAGAVVAEAEAEVGVQ